MCVTACGSGGVSPGPDEEPVFNADTRRVVPSRALTDLSPNLGAAGGGTVLTLIGAGFDESMIVTVGDRACGPLQLLSGTEARCVTPPASNLGAVAVEVEWVDGGTRSLGDRFSYIPEVAAQPAPGDDTPPGAPPPGRSPQPTPADPEPDPDPDPDPPEEPAPDLANAALVSPTQTAVAARTATYLVTHAGAYIPGVTASAGQAPGVEIELGLGPAIADPSDTPMQFDWTPGEYLEEGASENGTAGWDVYRSRLLVTAAGTYRIATRVRFAGDSEWTYVDLSGIEDGFTVEELPILTATR